MQTSDLLAPHRNYTVAELDEMPDLAEGQADNLKYEDKAEGVQVWLSRCTVQDGEPFNNKVTLCVWNRTTAKWEEREIYPAKKY